MYMLQLLTKIKPCSRPTCTCVPRLQKYALKIPISQIEEEILGREVENYGLNIRIAMKVRYTRIGKVTSIEQ